MSKSRQNKQFWLFFSTLIALGIGIRLIPCFNAFWLDEIWTYNHAISASSFWNVFERVHRENSHYLSTLFIYFLGNSPNWWGYRLPSFMAGALLLPLVALPMRKRMGDDASLATLLLFATSFFHITYSSEARGYAGVMLHSYLCYVLIELLLRKPERTNLIAWILAVNFVVGALWQPIFLLVWASFSLWALTSKLPVRVLLRGLGLPWALLAVLLALGVPLETAAQGPIRSKLEVLWSFLSAIFCVPEAWGAKLTLLLILASIILISFFKRPQFESKPLLNLRLILCVGPILGVLMAPSETLYERYFSASVPYLYLSGIYGLFWIISQIKAHHRWVAWGLGSAIITLNLSSVSLFMVHGRGHYLEALQWMSDHTTGESEIRWTTDHVFRNSMLVQFYAKYLPQSYFKLSNQWKRDRAPARWAIIHQIEDNEYAFPPRSISMNRVNYRWVHSFSKYGLSGFHWHLYEVE